MAAGTQDAAGYYVWEVAGKNVSVHLHLEVVDRILAEVMRGFGAVPKRGAEVGGVLIGTIEEGDSIIVRVEDFEPVECDYKRGPSYMFAEEDRGAFADAVERWEPGPDRPVYAVGYFRSHTREGMSLAPEDILIMEEFFPSPAQVALLVKPYGTKVSMAGFFFREEGGFQQITPLEFPFRRRELSGEEPPPRRSMIERRPRGHEPRPIDSAPPVRFNAPRFEDPPFEEEYAPEPAHPPQTAYAVTMPSRSRSSMWIPLSFVFLVFGVALGLMIGLARAPASSAVGDFALGLSVSRSDENLNVKWDRRAPAIRDAQRGTLEIEDGSYTKSVDLKSVDLHSGSIIYRNASSAVRFRLTVFPEERVSVTETAEWKQ
jgi:hypothetical protein